jgi:hypothetical protein
MLYEIIDNIEKSELTAEQKKVASEPFFNQIQQLESYDKTIKTTEVTTPIQEVTTTTRETGRRERPKTTVLTDRFNLEPVEVTDSEGNKSNFVAKVNEDGSISLVPKVKFSRTATEQKRKGIELDYNFLEFQESIKDENDRVIGAKLLDKKTGNIIEISNPELAIDLATKAKQDALGNVSEGVMSQEKTVTPIGQLTSIVKEFVNKRAALIAPQVTTETAEEEAPALVTETLTSPVGLPSRRAYVVKDDVETKKGNKILNKISPEIKKRIANYVKSLKATIPNSTVVLYDNKVDMIEGLVNQGYSRQEATKAVNESDGLYAGSSNTIHIDVMRMDKTTLPHEIFHPLVARLAKENPAEFIALRKRISKVLSESQLKELDAFAAQYSDEGKAVEAEEFLSQLGGLTTANKAKMERGTLMKLALAVKEFLKKIAAKTNSKALENFANSIFTEQTKTDDLIKFFEGFGRSLRQGEAINVEGLNSTVDLLGAEAYSESLSIEVPAESFKASKPIIKSKKIGKYSFPDGAVFESVELPIKSLDDIIKQYEGRVVIITSDATGYGVDSLGEPILGGFGFSTIKQNIDDNIGFASVGEKEVKSTMTRAFNIHGKGKAVVLIMIQPSFTTIGNSYGVKYFARGMREIAQKDTTQLEQLKVSMKEAILNSAEISEELRKVDAKKGKRNTEKALFKLIDSINKDTNIEEFTKEFLADTTFKSRTGIINMFLIDSQNVGSNVAAHPLKVALKEIGYTKVDFLNEYGDKSFLTKEMIESNAGGFVVGGFEIDIKSGKDMAEQISELQSKGIAHPLFNGKLGGTNHFALDGIYDVNENFAEFAKPESEITLPNEERDALVRDFYKEDKFYEAKYRETPLAERTYTQLKADYKSKFKDEVIKPTGALKYKTANVAASVARSLGFNLDEAKRDDLRKSEFKQRQKDTLRQQKSIRAINDVFDSTPELSNIGSSQQYSDYLDTVFPNSQFKDIVYHDTNVKFEKFEEDKIGKFDVGTLGRGFYFSGKGKSFYSEAKETINAILDIKNPALVDSTIYELGDYRADGLKKGEILIHNKQYLLDILPVANSDEKNTQKQIIGGIEKYFNKKIKESELSKIVRDIHIKNGYDGIMSSGTTAFSGEKEYVVFKPSQIHILGSKQDINGFKSFVNNNIRQKKSYPDAFEESRNEYLDKFKNTPKEVSRYLRKVLFERNINVKKAFEDAELEFSLYTMYNRAGASMFGNLKFTEKFNEIYGDLSTEDIKLLDNFILLRRTVAIDTNFDNREEPRPEHPDHKNIDGVKTATNKESALSTLEDYKDLLGDELYNKIYNSSDRYFKAFSDILKYKYDNGLINKETYELYKDYNYSPRKFLQFMFGTSISEESKLTTNNFYQRGLALSKDELSKIQSGSTKGLFVDSAKLLHAAMIATEVRVASNLALKTLYNEAIPANLDFVKEVEYEKYQDGTIKINPDGSLKYVKTADEGFRIVTFKEDGIVKAFQLKEDLAKEYFDEELFDKNSKAYKFAQIASGSNILRNMATGMNLAFFVTNIPVDALSQVQFSGIHDGASLGAPGQFASAIAGTLIKSGQLLPLEFGFKNKALEDLIYEYGKAGGLMMTLTEEYSSKAKFLGNIPKYLGSFGNASEMGSKLNAYEKVRNNEIKNYKEQNGKEPIGEDLAKIQTKAAYIARAAMDYHRGGLLTKWIDGFIPYLNVLSQATKITADYIVKNPKDFTDKITQMGIFVIGLTIYNLMVAGGDYDNDDNEQDLLTKIVIFSPFKDADGKRGKLEIGAPDMVKKFLNIFQSIGEGIYYQAILGEKQKTDEWKIAKRAQYLSSFDLKLPSNIPPALKAMVEYKYNLDLWRNKDITKQLGDVLPQDEGRYNPSVASFYKIIGSSTGMSPIRLQKASENFITQSNPLVGLGYSLMDKMVNNYTNLPESQRSKYDKGNISDIPLAAFDKIAGRLYSKTDPTVTYTKGKDIIDRINQTAGSKKQEAKAEMKLLVEKKASVAELNAFLIKQDPIYRKAAVEYRDMLQKKAKLNYPDFQEKYYDIMLGQNAEAKAQIVYTYFPYILNKGNEKLVQDLNELNLVSKDTKVYLNKYVNEKGIKE